MIPPAGGGTAESEALQKIDDIGKSKPKVEVALFQDCWMSTFETAYELADVVTYVIASQSLLPIGTDYADFVWPYEQLLADLLTANFQENLTTHVGDFYESNFSEIATLVTVHIALLDLGGVNGMTGPLKDLAKALKKVLTLDQRGLLIEQGQIVAFDQNGDLSAGDAALMDVQKMCVQMQTHPNPDISAAATSVLAGLTAVIKMTREAVPLGTQPTGFSGISVLYRPPPPRLLDDYITQAIHKASYLNLEFSKKTAWPATEQKRQN